MPCACERCCQNAATLGVKSKTFTRAAVRSAYRAAARKWHPDRFESRPAMRGQAEETFKRMHVAYSELWEHLEAPILLEPDPGATQEQEEAREPKQSSLPSMQFGGLKGCFAAPHLPGYIAYLLLEVMEASELALALVEMAPRNPLTGTPAEFVLFTNYRIVVRSELHLISMLWYMDLGDVTLAARPVSRANLFWKRILGPLFEVKSEYILDIRRRDGQMFYQFRGTTDDSAKKVIYNFLRQMKHSGAEKG